VTFESWSRFVARLRALQGAGLADWARRRRRTSLVLLALASVAGLALLALVIYSAVELARFDRVEARRAALIYTMPQALAVGVHIKIADLAGTLTRLRTHADAVRWNARLPCSGRIVSMTRDGSAVTATFRLGQRKRGRCQDPPGAEAIALFVVEHGKIVLWDQLGSQIAIGH